MNNITNVIWKSFISHKFSRTTILQARSLGTYKKYPSSRRTPKYWEITDRMMETSDWLSIGGRYKVCPWALSGVESCVVVVGSDFSVAFDMGYAYPAAVKCKHVFISHGHMDHVAAIVSHASKRGLYNMPPATYYVPPHLVAPLNVLADAYSQMNGSQFKLNLHPVTIDETIHLPGGIKVKPFPTIHRVPSQGYILYRVKKSLKSAYQGQASKAIGDLIKSGEDIFDIQTIPEVAYTGDTISDVFDEPHNPDLLKVNLLITESTYVDNENQGKSTLEKARDRGHMHIDEIIQKEQLFSDIKDIVLLHFSDKYSTRYIREQVTQKLPESMKDKVHLGLTLKEKFRT